MTKVFNRSTDKAQRKSLRRNATPAESALWLQSRDKGILGHKFRRQYGVDKYVVDFYCPQLKLAVEIDGDSHYQDGAPERDLARQRNIEAYGITFLRFTNVDVHENLDAVLEAIYSAVKEKTPPPAPPW